MIMKKGDSVYFVRDLSTSDVCDVYDCKVSTIEGNWFTIIEKREKHVFLFNMGDIGKTVFFDRGEAVMQAKLREKNRKKI